MGSHTDAHVGPIHAEPENLPGYSFRMFLQGTAQWAPSTFYEDPSGSAGTWTAPGARTTPKR
eukprot:3138948-Pyramimonas_sp.AAC.1